MRLRQTAVAICTLIAGRVFAQPALDSWDNLRQLRVGQKVEAVDVKMKPHQGEFLGHSTDSIRLRVGKDEVTLPRTDVISVKNREGPRRGRNALLGLGVGAGAGAVVGLIKGKTYHEEGETGVFMSIWAPVGAGVGAGVGAALPGRQTTVYRVATLPGR